MTPCTLFTWHGANVHSWANFEDMSAIFESTKISKQKLATSQFKQFKRALQSTARIHFSKSYARGLEDASRAWRLTQPLPPSKPWGEHKSYKREEFYMACITANTIVATLSMIYWSFQGFYTEQEGIINGSKLNTVSSVYSQYSPKVGRLFLRGPNPC